MKQKKKKCSMDIREVGVSTEKDKKKNKVGTQKMGTGQLVGYVKKIEKKKPLRLS